MSDFDKNLVIISGPSGTGKDTITQRLLAIDNRFALSVSATTRQPRVGEEDGVDYYFISEEDFSNKIESGDFIEYARYGKNYYGTLKQDVENRIKSGKTVILVIDVQGEANIKKLYPNVLSIFVMPPSYEILEKRLRGRNTDSEDAILLRLEAAKCEMEKCGEYDYVVVNDSLETAVDDAYKIITEHISK